MHQVLLNDYLLVDMSKASTSDYEADGYLEIEMAAVKGSEHKTSGGRRPNEDVIDRTLTVFINGLTEGKPLRTDGVKEPTRRASDTFPYLQPAVLSLKSWIAQKFTKTRHKNSEEDIVCPPAAQ